MKSATRIRLAVLLVLVATTFPTGAKSGETLRAVVSIPPQEYFVERVGGAHVEVKALVGSGQSPHNYQPTPKQMARLAGVEVFLRVGWPFEERLLEKLRAIHPELTIVDLREGIELRPMAGRHHHEDGERAHHARRPAETDPHTWLDPRNVMIMARTICATLKALDPGRSHYYERNLQRFLADLERVDGEVERALAPLRGREILVYHPSYGYFADRYGLRQVAVEVGGKEPTAKQLARLIDRARQNGTRVIFVQPQFSRRSASTLAGSIDGAVVPLDPLARAYLDNLEQMARRVTAGLGGG